MNSLSVTEHLATSFKPISPPPYLNGGPTDYLRWIIEAQGDNVSTEMVADFLEGRLPKPVDDLSKWGDEDEDEDEDDDEE